MFLTVMLIEFLHPEKLIKYFISQGNILMPHLDKASDENERNYVKMTNSNGDELNFGSNSRSYCKKNCL